MVIRTTALSFLYAMFSASKAVQLVALTLMVLSGLYGLAVLFTIFLICHPAAAAWDTSISGTCGCQIVSYISLETLGALVDLAILALPIIALRPLQMSLRQKCEVLGWLSIGAVDVVTPRLRLWWKLD